tara:strand:- start:50 stop:256 length:207 start_codon:yes stop_codon:yes gene_type:complete
MKKNQNSTRPELNIKYTTEDEIFDTEDMIKIFDKIYELKYDKKFKDNEKFKELLDWISDGDLIYKYSR